MDNYEAVGLYEHNARSYEKVKKAYETEDVVGIVHATGTGKSFNALQLAYDNSEKEIVYVVPSNGIIEHIEKIISDNPNLDRKRDFPNLHFRTYQSFINLSSEEMESIPCDLLVLDEFHHIGAPIWGSQINKLKETHPNMKVFGMTAYTVRDRGTSYERDMVDSNGNELFSNKIVSRYDLCDAMIDGVLPKPIYKSAYIHLVGTLQALEKKIEGLNHNTKEYTAYQDLLTSVKRKIQEAPSIPELLKKSIKPDGKYIYFCPPVSEEGTNDIETIKKQAMEWFKGIGYKEEDIEFYTSTSEMEIEGSKNREAFYNDETLSGEKATGKLRIMFAINQYNEGIHAPNIDGVIMGRGTSSDIVFFEQLGRALSVRGNTKEEYDRLDKYSREELVSMCLDRDILIKVGTPKEEIIEKLLAPTIIDLTNNIGFIRELEINLKNRIKTIQELKNDNPEKRTIKISDASFDITMENEDLFETLKYIMDNLTNTWEQNYELAKAYYEHHGDLLIPAAFKTINGYESDENGINIGMWILRQRKSYKKSKNSEELYGITLEQIEKLESIGMVWDAKELIDIENEKNWNEKYALAKIYYEHHGDLLIPQTFKTKNGYERDNEGTNLGDWISKQRKAYKGTGRGKITSEQIEKLESIGMIWDAKELIDIENEKNWNENYSLAKMYYEHYHNLMIPTNWRTINGYDEVTEEMPKYEDARKLGDWIARQRKSKKGKGTSRITLEQIEKLEAIGMIWDAKELIDIENEKNWNENYSLAKIYYEHYGDLLIPQGFKTKNGYKIDKDGTDLGVWISKQRNAYNGTGKGKLTSGRIKRLEAIGMIWNAKKLVDIENEKNWNENYSLAKTYYEHYHNLMIPTNWRTINGYDEVTEEMPEYENSRKLGRWIARQRTSYKKGKFTSEQIKKLEAIGMIWDIKKNKQGVYEFCDNKGIDSSKNKTVLDGISARIFQIKTSFLEERGEKTADENGYLHPIYSMSSPNMHEKYGVTLEQLYTNYYEAAEKEVQK